MGGTLLWFGIYCLWAVVFFTVVLPLLRGRISSHDYHAYLQSPEWAAVTARLAATRRGKRCAACGTTEGLAEPHHVTYVNLGYERTWQLVRLCRRHHTGRWSVHSWSEWLFSSRTRGLVFTTALVVGYGKAKRLGRRAPHGTTARRAA